MDVFIICFGYSFSTSRTVVFKYESFVRAMGAFFKIFQWLMPYMIFVCLAAIFSGALNSIGRFFSASFAPVLFNVVLISAILVGISRGGDESVIIVWLCGGVLLGGFVQLLLPLIDLRKQGWKVE